MKKRKDGRYSKQVTIGIKNGKPIKKTVYGQTIKEVEKNYRDLIVLIEKGVSLDSQTITLSELMKEWYKMRLEGKIRVNSVNTYASYMNRIENGIGYMKVKDITTYRMELYIKEIEKEGLTATAKSVLHMLKVIFDYAIQHDIVVKNPCIGLSVKHIVKKKRTLTEDEKESINNIDKAILSKKEIAFILIARYTGMRRGEIFSLSKSDIDKKKLLININKTLVDDNGKPFVQDLAKTEAGKREVPIFLPLYKPLFDYIDTLDTDYLFLNKNKKFMASNSIVVFWEKIQKEMNFGEDLTLHCFRHNFISECYMAGIDVKKIQSWVGHEDVNVTLNTYTKLDKEYVRNSDDMNRFYGSQTEVKVQKII